MLPAHSQPERSLRERIALALLLFGTFFLSACWSVATPVPTPANATLWGNFHPDESSHAAVIRYMATRYHFPPYAFPYDTSVHPPLYHGLAAMVYALVVRIIGNQAALLELRLLTGFCGVGVVFLTYQATRQIAAARTALFAGALVALIPMRVAIGGSLSNENLAALGAAGALAAIVGGLCQADGFTPRRLATLTVWIVVGVGSKVTCLGLIPVAALALGIAAWKKGLVVPPTRHPLLTAGRQTLGLVAAVGVVWGLYFWRNVRLYGDPFRKAAADRLWSGRQPGYTWYATHHHFSRLHYLLSMTATGWRSFWGYFDAFSRPLPIGVYLMLLAFQGIALFGLVCVYLRKASVQPRPPLLLVLLFALYAITVGAVFVQFNWSHFTPQGRYFFVLLLPFGMLTAIGWRGAVEAWTTCPVWLRRVADGIPLGLLILNLYLLYVIPRRLPMPGSAGGTPRSAAVWHRL